MKPINRIWRIILPIFAIICVALFTSWTGEEERILTGKGSIQDHVDVAIEQGMDGVIVYIDQAGKAPKWYTAGWKDKEMGIPADSQALFKIASISKLYIAVAAVKLVQAQRLSLDDKLATLLPDLSKRIEFADQISLKMLLQHRSGIPNFTADPAFSWTESHTDSKETLALVLDEPADFRPDKRYHYSNTNYLLIGEILDSVLGYSHRQYIQDEIVHPLGLTHTFGLLSDVPEKEVVNGYTYPKRQEMKTFDYGIAGGSMVATAQDVGIFLRALNDGSLLSEKEQEMYASVYEFGHTGLLPGYQSIARYHEKLDAVVVQFVNTTGGSFHKASRILYYQIVDILKKQKHLTSAKSSQ